MIKINKIGLLIWVACILFATENVGYCQPSITILVEEDCPYSCRSEEENGRNGFVQDILKVIFERNGYKTDYKIVPWLRALDIFNAEAPGIDGMIGMKVHPIDKTIAVYPEEEIARYTHRFYARKDSDLIDNWQYTGVESLLNLRIGCVEGWNYCDKEITKHLANGTDPHVQALSGDAVHERNLKKLLAGRIDLWVANINNAEYLISEKRKAGSKNIAKIIGFWDLPVTNEVNVYPVFLKHGNGNQYASIFTKGIRILRKSGELKAIMARYGLSDWKK